jgi:hypothetical protein
MLSRRYLPGFQLSPLFSRKPRILYRTRFRPGAFSYGSDSNQLRRYYLAIEGHEGHEEHVKNSWIPALTGMTAQEKALESNNVTP